MLRNTTELRIQTVYELILDGFFGGVVENFCGAAAQPHGQHFAPSIRLRRKINLLSYYVYI